MTAVEDRALDAADGRSLTTMHTPAILAHVESAYARLVRRARTGGAGSSPEVARLRRWSTALDRLIRYAGPDGRYLGRRRWYAGDRPTEAQRRACVERVSELAEVIADAVAR